MSFGKAYVFYPEVSDAQTTMALLLDINPIDLARGKLGTSEGGLFDYVNDRPYVSSSFMSTALVRIFNTAMQGKCDKMQVLADTPLSLSATVHIYRTLPRSSTAVRMYHITRFLCLRRLSRSFMCRLSSRCNDDSVFPYRIQNGLHTCHLIS